MPKSWFEVIFKKCMEKFKKIYTNWSIYNIKKLFIVQNIYLALPQWKAWKQYVKEQMFEYLLNKMATMCFYH